MNRKKIIFLILTITIVSSIFAAFFIYNKHQNGKDSTFFYKNTSGISGFRPYFVTTPIPGFKLKKESLVYKNNVLVFTLTDKSSKTLVFTEQATNNYDYSALKGDREFNTPNGKAFITDGQLRTTGALFTNDKTWILINAPSPVGADLMQQVINALG